MPIARADRGLRASLLGASVIAALLVSGCAGTVAPAAPGDVAGGPAGPGTPAGQQPNLPAPTGAVDGTPPLVEGMAVPPDLDAAFSQLLDRRAQAILARDRTGFVDVLDTRDEGFVVAQEGYFANLAQLPLAALSYAVDPSSLVRGARGYSVVVEISMQLDGFDALPVRTLDRFRFDRVGRASSGRYLLASVTDRAWEETHDIQAQPWEERPVQVRRGAGVLAVFDDASVRSAPGLMGALERSVSDVAARVPYAWDRSVVVYALSDTDFIRTLDDLPGDSPDALDGIAFTVPAGPGDPRTVATRIVLNPRILTRGGEARERLLRHELTHVAVAERDDHAPAWLSEGIAEWVSVQALPEGRRQVSADALRAARREAGGIDALPADATFNDDDSALHYAISWWACEYLAAAYGPTAPWSVLDAFAEPGVPEGPTIQTLLQISTTKLARRATALLVDTYAPEPSPEPSSGVSPKPSSGTSTGPRDTPTDTPSRSTQ